jgi:hypothetical protein
MHCTSVDSDIDSGTFQVSRFNSIITTNHKLPLHIHVQVQSYTMINFYAMVHLDALVLNKITQIQTQAVLTCMQDRVYPAAQYDATFASYSSLHSTIIYMHILQFHQAGNSIVSFGVIVKQCSIKSSNYCRCRKKSAELIM